MNFKVVRVLITLLLLLILMGVLIPLIFALLGQVWAKQFVFSAHDILYPYKVLMNVVVAVFLMACGLIFYKPVGFLKNISEEQKKSDFMGQYSVRYGC